MTLNDLIPLLVLLPFFGAATIGLLGFLLPSFRKQEGLIGAFATSMVALPFFIFLWAFLSFDGKPFDVNVLSWMETKNLSITFGYHLDQLSILMGMIVTGIGALIHIFSISYMHGESGYYKYFLYLNLFIFSMLNLILGDNMVVMFLGWEGVGACSYFLIGFWFEDMEKAKAAQKAFVANRIGDFALLIAIFLVYNATGTLKFQDFVYSGFDASTLHWICFLVFVAATGKSAQIPLYVWLPDAMAGPTPVSALIHAATMVTSGIYLISRMSWMFIQAPAILTIICVVGGLTAIVAATIALTQNDIKKVLAYSTVSQLGFMFMALGAGAFSTAIFHVMTHAFFKACMFLGSGSVIHGMHHAHAAEDPQDIRTMGGLRKFMPSTAMTFWLSTLAIAGIPGLSGFFSKDEILGKVFAAGHENFIYYFVWVIGVLTAFTTAFYMYRLYTLTFEGKERFDSHHHHVHESPAIVTGPLWALAILAVIGGFFGLPSFVAHTFGSHAHINWITEHWLAAEGKPLLRNAEGHMGLFMEWFLMLFSAGVGIVGVLVAKKLYTEKALAGDDVVKQKLGGLYKLFEAKYYVDEIYNKVIIRPFVMISEKLVFEFDKQVVDGAVNGSGFVARMLGSVLKLLQTGYVSDYALVMVVGIVLVLGYLIF